MAAAAIGLGLQAFSMGLNIASGFRKVQEFKKQMESQKVLIDEHTRMVNIQREQQLADTELRRQIVEGQVIARSGAAGVTADSKSIINAAAEVVRRATIDKVRININADSQVFQDKVKKVEMDRQGRAAQRQAVWDTISGIAGVGGQALSQFGGTGGGSPSPVSGASPSSSSLTTMREGALTQTGPFYED